MDRATEYVVAVELGGAWISCLVASMDGGELNVLGWGRQPSAGFHRGELADLTAASECIEAAVCAAEQSAFVRAQTVFLAAASSHYRGLNSRGCVPITREDRIVTEETRREAIGAAERISLPNEREIVDVIPQSFTLDEMRWLDNPIGMTGSRLEAEVHVATDAACYLHNIAAAVEGTHCQVEGIICKPLAAARAVLTQDETRLGALAIDLGAATMNLALFRGGAPRFSAVLPIGGQHLTHDIAMCLNIPVEQAEQLKTSRACACRASIQPDRHKETFDVTTCGGSVQGISVGRLCSIVECRVEEMFSIASSELSRAGYGGSYQGGVVLTGGSADMRGIEQAARRAFGCPARIGRPRARSRLGAKLEQASWATCVGTLYCGLQQRRSTDGDPRARGGALRRVLSRGINWARAAF